MECICIFGTFEMFKTGSQLEIKNLKLFDTFPPYGSDAIKEIKTVPLNILSGYLIKVKLESKN